MGKHGKSFWYNLFFIIYVHISIHKYSGPFYIDTSNIKKLAKLPYFYLITSYKFYDQFPQNYGTPCLEFNFSIFKFFCRHIFPRQVNTEAALVFITKPILAMSKSFSPYCTSLNMEKQCSSQQRLQWSRLKIWSFLFQVPNYWYPQVGLQRIDCHY